MDLSEPLSGLTSHIEAAVLRVLAGADTAFSGRQVHRLSGAGSTSSVHRALRSLAEVGLVDAETQAPAILYRANRDHLLWQSVQIGLGARASFFERTRAFCADEFADEEDVTVILYGSVARRASTSQSDIDLFLIYPDGISPDVQADASYRMSVQIRRWTGNDAQVYAIERTAFQRREDEHDPVLENVREDGILLYGRPVLGLKEWATA